MVVIFVLAVSILLQFSAAVLALRLILVTRKCAAWALIATAVFFMTVRRCITLFRLISGDLGRPPDLSAELVALVISALMVTGIARIAPLFLSIRRSEETLQEYSERLEEMVEERTKALEEAQEQLVRQEKLAVLGQLAGGVAHELRNPLGVISNAVYYLQMTPSDADETTREYLGIISSEVRDADRIVSGLLDFSRTMTPDREKVVVSDLVAQVLERRPAPENVEVITEIAPDLPPVFVDPQQIGQVLGNLVTNAYQAMPEGRRLTIETSEVSGKPPRSVAISITDTGCGIPAENRERLFEPLFTTKAKGIGLGLAVSKNMVEANGGSIEVESTMGEGSTFTVRLPASG